MSQVNFTRRILAIGALWVLTSLWTQAQQPAPPPPPAGAPTEPQTKPSTEPLPQQKTPAITSTTGLVHLVATVMDRHRDFVTDLDQADFKVLEDGTPQDIRYFGRAAP